ncbi:hypothetical protein HSBAA_17320 [Vreelandella sulfidaeris]|uniref:ABC transporter domain-containing protein n=1 Tax=Vreelandella sulfidaeris TaxID=115553 RepID=A0A455U347_9GAMM|nr:hypothetical protein HSBAA_17320 [Halomonas sulfidaeris]
MLNAGQWVGLSGDSGSGKSTLGKLLAGYLTPQVGDITLDGAALPKNGVQPVQWLPQSPELAVNPRWRVGKILREAWTPSDAQCEAFGVHTIGCRASLNRSRGVTARVRTESASTQGALSDR